MYQDLIVKAMWLVVCAGGVPLLLIAGVGTLVSFFQAALQVQEQSLAYLIKLTVFILVVAFGAPIFWELLLEYAQEAFCSGGRTVK